MKPEQAAKKLGCTELRYPGDAARTWRQVLCEDGFDVGPELHPTPTQSVYHSECTVGKGEQSVTVATQYEVDSEAWSLLIFAAPFGTYLELLRDIRRSLEAVGGKRLDQMIEYLSGETDSPLSPE